MSHTERPAAAFLRRRDVVHLTGLSYSTIYRKMRLGQFPGRVKLSEKTVGWRETEVRAWMDQCERIPAATPTPAAPVTSL
jgi:prophage regulatory protein